MSVRVEHDDREGEDVGSIGVGELGSRVSGDVSFGELEDESIDLLGFSWETEGLEVGSNGVGELHVAEVEHVYEGVHDGDVGFVSECEKNERKGRREQGRVSDASSKKREKRDA